MNKNIKKRLFEKEIDGRRMRYCMKYNIWVNREGTYAYREYKDPAWNHALQIHTRPDGSKYLDTKSHGEIPLDEAVAICFRIRTDWFPWILTYAIPGETVMVLLTRDVSVLMLLWRKPNW